MGRFDRNKTNSTFAIPRYRYASENRFHIVGLLRRF